MSKIDDNFREESEKIEAILRDRETYDAKTMTNLGWQKREIIAILQRHEDRGRSIMCVHKKRDEIGGDCEVCAEIVKVGGEQYQSGWNMAIEKAKGIADKEVDKCDRGCLERTQAREIADKIGKLKRK
jgi:hypothetical protein